MQCSFPKTSLSQLQNLFNKGLDSFGKIGFMNTIVGAFHFVPPPPPHVMRPPAREHVSFHSNSLCKDMARAFGGCKKYAPTKLGGGGHKRK